MKTPTPGYVSSVVLGDGTIAERTNIAIVADDLTPEQWDEADLLFSLADAQRERDYPLADEMAETLGGRIAPAPTATQECP